MDGIMRWAGNILFFLVFLTVLENLLPGKKYGRYLRLFTGMILILLVMKPLTGSLKLEERIARYYESLTFRQEAEELSENILGIEQRRRDQVIESYETAVAEDVMTMARDSGYVPVSARAEIEKDESKETFGSVIYIELEVEQQGREASREEAVFAVSPVEQVKPVLVEREETTQQTEEPFRQQTEAGEDDESLEKLKRKVGSFYGLETGNVEIQYKTR